MNPLEHKSENTKETPSREELLLRIQSLEEKNKSLEKIINNLKADFGSLVLSTKYFFDIMGPIIDGFINLGFDIPKLVGQLKKTMAVIKAHPKRFEQVSAEYFPTIKKIVGRYAPAFEKEAQSQQAALG